jgi:hypothetical protein
MAKPKKQDEQMSWGCIGFLFIVVIIIFLTFKACGIIEDSDSDIYEDPSYNEDADYNSDGKNDSKDEYIEQRNETSNDN